MMVGIGFWKRQLSARLAGITLMAVTLIKVMLLDMAGLDSLYRVGAFIGMAVLALGASFLYQRFAHRR
jgi:uncharacterized membrane protein